MPTQKEGGGAENLGFARVFGYWQYLSRVAAKIQRKEYGNEGFHD